MNNVEFAGSFKYMKEPNNWFWGSCRQTIETHWNGSLQGHLGTCLPLAHLNESTGLLSHSFVNPWLFETIISWARYFNTAVVMTALLFNFCKLLKSVQCDPCELFIDFSDDFYAWFSLSLGLRLLTEQIDLLYDSILRLSPLLLCRLLSFSPSHAFGYDRSRGLGMGGSKFGVSELEQSSEIWVIPGLLSCYSNAFSKMTYS